MSIQHIVLLELNDGVSDETAQGALTAIAGLKDKVPGILDIKTGKNFTDRAGNISHGAVVTLKDKDALAGYGPHPAHQEVVATLKQHVKNITVVDFEA